MAYNEHWCRFKQLWSKWPEKEKLPNSLPNQVESKTVHIENNAMPATEIPLSLTKVSVCSNNEKLYFSLYKSNILSSTVL